MGEFLVEAQGHRQFCSQEINFPVCLAEFCPAGMSWRSCWAVAFSAAPAPGTQGMYGHGAGAVSSTSVHLGTVFYQPAELFVALSRCIADLLLLLAGMSELPGIPDPEHIPGRSSAPRAADSGCGAITGCSCLWEYWLPFSIFTAFLPFLAYLHW